MDWLKAWVFNSLIAIDQFINAFFLFGYPDETISSRLGRHSPNCKFCRGMCKVLSFLFFDPDHCKIATQSEVSGNQLPRALRKLREQNHVDIPEDGKS